MSTTPERRPYHPLFRLLAVLVPAAALVAVALLIWQRQTGRPREADTASVPPPAAVEISPVAFAPIDTIIAGGAEAFAEENWDDAARLLSRARFFIESGIREGSIEKTADNIDLFIGLAEFYRGHIDRGIENVTREVEADPLDGQAVWYLASMLDAAGRRAEARGHLERLAHSDGPWAARAREALERF